VGSNRHFTPRADTQVDAALHSPAEDEFEANRMYEHLSKGA
jgi:hypothetical protein